MYVKSHHSFAPGEQAHRNYKWSKDPSATVWGAPSDLKKTEENVKESLVWQAERDRYDFCVKLAVNMIRV
jgi:hypothetical protein